MRFSDIPGLESEKVRLIDSFKSNEIHHAILTQQGSITNDKVDALVQEIGIDTNKIREDLERDEIEDTLRITSFADVHPFSSPFNLIPIILGNFNSQGIPAITSTASAPPTPIATIPNPPALTV